MPVGFHIASAWVDIRAEDKGLRQQVKNIIRDAAAGQKITVPLNIDSKGLRDELSRAMKEASKGQGTAIPIKIDSKGLRAALNAAVKEATAGQGIDIPVRFSTIGLRNELNRAIKAATLGQGVSIPVKFDNKPVLSGLRDIEGGLGRLGSSAGTAGGHMSRFGKLALAAVTLVPPALAALDHILRVVGPSTGVLVTAFSALALMGVTVAVGMNGVGEAIKQSGQSAKKYADALAKLSPNAKAFVESVVSMKGAFKGLQIEVQQTLFKGLDNEIRQMAQNTIPSFRIGLGGMAMILNSMARGVMSTTTNLAQMGHLKIMFGALQSSMEPLIKVPGQILNALVKLTIASAPLFVRMTTATGKWFSDMTTKLNTAFDSGRLQAAVTKSGDAIIKFFKTIANNPEWKTFLANMKLAGPEMAMALAHISEAALKLLNNLSPLAGALLHLLGIFAQLVVALPDGLIKSVLALATALKLLTLAAKGLEAIRLAAMGLGLLQTSSAITTRSLLGVGAAARTTGASMATLGTTTAVTGLTATGNAARTTSTSMGTLSAASVRSQVAMTATSTSATRAATGMGALSAANIRGQVAMTATGTSATAAATGMTSLSAASIRNQLAMDATGASAARAATSMTVLSAAAIRNQVALAATAGSATRAATSMTVLSAASIRTAAASQSAAASATAANAGFALWPARTSAAAAGTTRLGGSLTSAGASMAGMARGAGIAGLAMLAAVPAINAVTSSFRSGSPDVDKMTTALSQYARTGTVTSAASSALGGNLQHLAAATKAVVDPGAMGKIEQFREGLRGMLGLKGIDGGGLKGLAANIFGLGNTSDKASGLVKSFDGALADMVKSGDSDTASAAFAKFAEQAGKAGVSTDQLKSKLPQYRAALESAKEAQNAAAESMGAFGQKALEVQLKLDTNKKSADGLAKSYGALNTAAQGALGGQVDFETAIAAAKSGAVEFAGSLHMQNGELNLTSEKSRGAASALNTAASSTQSYVNKVLESGGSWDTANAAYERGRKTLIASAVQMGLTRAQAQALADRILAMPSKEIILKAKMDTLTRDIENAQSLVDGLKQKQKTAVGVDKTAVDRDLAAAQKTLDGLIQKKKVAVEAQITDINTQISKAQALVDGLKQKRKTAVDADKAPLDAAIGKAQKNVDGLKQKRAALIDARDNTGPGVAAAKAHLDSVKDKTVTISIFETVVKTSAAAASALAAQGAAQKKKAWGGLIGFDGGGAISGPGGPMSDSIMAMVSNGEFVMRASSVKKYGTGMMSAINTGMFPKFAAGGKVAGGAAGGAPGGGGGAAGGPGVAAPGAVPIKAIDATKPATDSAKANIASVPVAAQAAFVAMKTQAQIFGIQYKAQFDALGLGVGLSWNNWRVGMQTTAQSAFTGIGMATTAFGLNQTSQLTTASTTSRATWAAMGAGLTATTNASYGAMNASTAAFRGSSLATLNTASSGGQSIWSSYGSGMISRSNATYNNIRGATNSMGAAVSSKLAGTRTDSHRTWDSFNSGMTSRTKATYSNITGATNQWSSGTVTKFTQTKNAVGAAWDGVRPKLAAPIKYLINNVINAGVVPAMNSVVSKLGGSAVLTPVSAAGFATGGYVSGPGTGTSDSIPARLSNGEFVMRAAAVSRYGAGYLNAMNSGKAVGTQARAGGGVVGLAGGGLAMVTGASKASLEAMLGKYSTADYQKLADWIWENAIEPLLAEAPGGSAMKGVLGSASKVMHKQGVGYLEANILNPNLAGGDIAGAVKFADAQIGLPYQYGGGMDPSFDCSSFMSSIAKVILGQDPHGRVWSTMDFQGQSAPTGWKWHGDSAFKIGVTNGPNNDGGKNGHTAGTLGGVNYEATPPVLRKGPSARGYNDPMFPNWYGFMPAAGGIGNYKPGAGVAQWTAVTQQALTEAGQSLSLVNTVLHQMDTESSGNPFAVNLTDSNAAAGYPSVGLMQVIRPTFQAYAGKHINDQPQAYGVSEAPLANIFSAIKYVLSQYGSVAAGMRGVAYAAGGHVQGPGTGTSDSINARLSNGEYVMQSSSVRKYGVGYMQALNSGMLPGFSRGGWHNGSGSGSGGGVNSDGTYTVKSGDTLSGIAQKLNTTVDKLIAANNITNKDMIEVGQIIKTGGATTGTYLIKAGDTLSQIAVAFHTTVQELMRLNKNIRNADQINAGDTIHVPGGTGGGGTGGGSNPPPPPAWFKLDQADAAKVQAISDATYQTGYGAHAGVPDAGDYVPKFAAAMSSMQGTLDVLEEIRHTSLDAFKDSAGRTALISFLDTSAYAMLDWENKLLTNTASLEDATKKLQDIQGQFDSLKNSVAASVVSFGSIMKVAKYGTSSQTLITQLQTDVSKATAFAAQLEALKTKGVSADLIQQVAEAGLAGGGVNAATSLLGSTPAQIAQLNALQAQLVAASTRTGTAAANAMYGAGLAAAQGLVDGLTAEKAAIQTAMINIAKSIEVALKQALGIKSPSRVMKKWGRFVPLGLAEGITDNTHHVADAVRAMCRITSDAVSVPLPGTTPAPDSGTMGRTYGGNIHIDNLNINVAGTIDISKPNAARDFAKQLAPAIKEELREFDRKRR